MVPIKVILGFILGLYWGIMEKEMETTIMGYIGIIGYMGGCQNYGFFLGPYYNTARSIKGTQEGTIILTTTHMGIGIR